MNESQRYFNIECNFTKITLRIRVNKSVNHQNYCLGNNIKARSHEIQGQRQRKVERVRRTQRDEIQDGSYSIKEKENVIRDEYPKC